MSLKKLFFTIVLILYASFSFTSFTHAQTREFDTLSFIKGELGEENIQVIDFSAPENEWGSLPPEWAGRMDKKYSDLQGVASFFVKDFDGPEGLNELRYQKAVLESRKTRVGTQAERDELDEEIELLEEEIADLEEAIKTDLAGSFHDVHYTTELAKEGANLLFIELDKYFSTAQWGGLPYPIARALRDDSGLCSAQDVCNLQTLAEDYLELGEKEGLELLQQDLEPLTYEDSEGNEVELTPADVEEIFTAMRATQFEGESQINAAILTVVRAIRNLLGALAILWIVIAGIRMVLAQGEESAITEQKRSILYGLLGLAIILLLERLIAILYGTPGAVVNELQPNRQFDAEVYGVVSFIRAVIGIIAVAVLVRSGIRAMAAQGQDDEIKKQRQAGIWVGAGLVVIAINRVIVENIFIAPVSQDDQIYTSNIANIIGALSNIFKFLLGFLGIIALGILVWGAGMMIINYGDEELVNKAKKLIKNAIIGILVVIAAYTIVATLVRFG